MTESRRLVAPGQRYRLAPSPLVGMRRSSPALRLVLGLLAALMLAAHAGAEVPSFDADTIVGQPVLQSNEIGDDEVPDPAGTAAAICAMDAAACPPSPFVSVAATGTRPAAATDETADRSAPAKWERPPDRAASP